MKDSNFDFEKEISRVIRKIDCARNGIEQIDCNSLDLSNTFNNLKYGSSI